MPSLDRTLIGTVLEPIVAEVEKGEIRQFADAIGATDPIHTDPEAARAAGYPNLVAPPTFVFCLSQRNSEPTERLVELGFDVAKLLHGEQHFEHFHPVCAGDTITLSTRIEDIYEKKGGLLEFMVQKTDAVNRDGALCATMTAVVVQRHG